MSSLVAAQEWSASFWKVDLSVDSHVEWKFLDISVDAEPLSQVNPK